METVQTTLFRSAILPEYLVSILQKDIVPRLNSLLDQSPRVSISWNGKRMVSIDGYEGSVEIDQIARKYLQAPPFVLGNSTSSLQEKLDCYNLWDKVQNLYEKSDEELKKTWLFRYLVPAKEFRPYCRACAGDPQAMIKGWDGDLRRESVFEFTPEQFREIWPDAEPQGKSWSSVGGARWCASKEMVEEYISD